MIEFEPRPSCNWIDCFTNFITFFDDHKPCRTVHCKSNLCLRWNASAIVSVASVGTFVCHLDADDLAKSWQFFRSEVFFERGACIAEWYHTWLWTSLHFAMPWAVRLSLGDGKLFIGPIHNIYGFSWFHLFDLILLCVHWIFDVNSETENWN